MLSTGFFPATGFWFDYFGTFILLLYFPHFICSIIGLILFSWEVVVVDGGWEVVVVAERIEKGMGWSLSLSFLFFFFAAIGEDEGLKGVEVLVLLLCCH